MIPITCTHCGGASQIDQAWRGQWVQCPYCAKPTQAGGPPVPPAVPSVPPLPPAPPSVELIDKPNAEAKQQAETKPASGAKSQASAPDMPAPRPPLTREQRLAIRRRLHLLLAVGGGVLLVAVAYLLFLLRQ